MTLTELLLIVVAKAEVEKLTELRAELLLVLDAIDARVFDAAGKGGSY